MVLLILICLLSIHGETFKNSHNITRQRKHQSHKKQPQSPSHLVPIPSEFVKDAFNRQGLSSNFKSEESYKEHLASLLQTTSSKNNANCDSKLYQLIHSRYVVTPGGIAQFEKKLIENPTLFGSCPRLKCKRQQLLPMAKSLRYCPSCGEALALSDNDNDNDKNDCFGYDNNFAHLFMMMKGEDVFPHLYRRENWEKKDVPIVPSVFGFKIYHHTLDKN